MTRPSYSAYREIPAMKILIPAFMVLALAATGAHAQSTERHCLECDSVASPADPLITFASQASRSDAVVSEPGGLNSVAGPGDPMMKDETWRAVAAMAGSADPRMKIEHRRSTPGH